MGLGIEGLIVERMDSGESGPEGVARRRRRVDAADDALRGVASESESESLLICS